MLALLLLLVSSASASASSSLASLEDEKGDDLRFRTRARGAWRGEGLYLLRYPSCLVYGARLILRLIKIA